MASSRPRGTVTQSVVAPSSCHTHATYAHPTIGGGVAVTPDQSGNATSPTSCHITGYAQSAIDDGDRCGHLCCAEHVCHQTIERRVYREEIGYQSVLECALSRFEAYTLRIRCSSTLFTGKAAQRPLLLP